MWQKIATVRYKGFSNFFHSVLMATSFTCGCLCHRIHDMPSNIGWTWFFKVAFSSINSRSLSPKRGHLTTSNGSLWRSWKPFDLRSRRNVAFPNEPPIVCPATEFRLGRGYKPCNACIIAQLQSVVCWAPICCSSDFADFLWACPIHGAGFTIMALLQQMQPPLPRDKHSYLLSSRKWPPTPSLLINTIKDIHDAWMGYPDDKKTATPF